MSNEIELDDFNLEDIKSASISSQDTFSKNKKKIDLNEKKIDDIIKELFSEDEDSNENFKEDNKKQDNKQDFSQIQKEQVHNENKDENEKRLEENEKEEDEKEEEQKDNEYKNDIDIRMDFTWLPLNKKWSEKLMSKKFMEKDCIGDGDCQFRSIETALTNAGYKMDNNKLRRILGKYINKLPNEHFYNILQNYRIEKQNGEFKGGWNPFYVKTKRQFINNIVKSGFHFEGDSITLELLSKALGVDFIIFDNKYNITDLSDTENLNDKLIILYYTRDASSNNNGHYKTIGLSMNETIDNRKDNKILTIFKRNKLPKEIDIILDKHTFLLEHIKELYGGYNKEDVKLNKILYDIGEKLDIKLTSSDKKKIMVILRNWLQNLDYFKEIKNTQPHIV